MRPETPESLFPGKFTAGLFAAGQEKARKRAEMGISGALIALTPPRSRVSYLLGLLLGFVRFQETAGEGIFSSVRRRRAAERCPVEQEIDGRGTDHQPPTIRMTGPQRGPGDSRRQN
jgi:hypothetical protein